VWSLSYSGCNVHAPYCHLRPARLYRIFLHYLINGTFKRSYWKQTCTLIFSTTLETFLILIWIEQDTIKMYIGLNVKYLLLLSSFNETWIISTTFRKIFIITFHEYPPSGSQVVICGRTDWNDEANIRNSANAPKNGYALNVTSNSKLWHSGSWSLLSTFLPRIPVHYHTVVLSCSVKCGIAIGVSPNIRTLPYQLYL
jgi:hypothetical protein